MSRVIASHIVRSSSTRSFSSSSSDELDICDPRNSFVVCSPKSNSVRINRSTRLRKARNKYPERFRILRLPLRFCALSTRETVAAVSSNAESASAGSPSTFSAWLSARPLISYATARTSVAMALPRQSTGLILNLPSERWSDIEYPYADLRTRNGAYPVEVDWPPGTDASASRSPPANPDKYPS